MDRRRADKPPAPSPQVLAQRNRLVGNPALHQGGMADQGLSWLGFVGPDVRGKAAKFLDQLSMAARVVDRRVDLGAVANDASVSHQAGGVPRTESRHHRGFEIAKRSAEV